MSSTRPHAQDATAETLATAPFVRVVAASDGDSLAAAGILAGACETRATPFQLRVGRDADTEDAVTVAVGPVGVDSDVTLPTPASPAAYEIATALDADPDPVLALAGTIAAGETVESATEALEAAEDSLQRRPGVAIPTEEYPAGLAASTLLYAPFSGNESAAEELIAELRAEEDPDAFDRRLASLVALDTVTAEGATGRAAEQVERALRPYATPDGPFATLGGYADVLEAVARTAPGTGIRLVLGRGGTEEALDAWQTHGETVHRLLREADTARHHGLTVLSVPGADPAALPAVARLYRDFRSPEPLVLAVTDGAAAVAGEDAANRAGAAGKDAANRTGAAGEDAANRTGAAGEDDVGQAITAATAAVGGTAQGTATTGTARFDTERTEFTDAFREAL